MGSCTKCTEPAGDKCSLEVGPDSSSRRVLPPMFKWLDPYLLNISVSAEPDHTEPPWAPLNEHCCFLEKITPMPGRILCMCAYAAYVNARKLAPQVCPATTQRR